jgi:hypothetical protein
MDEKQYISSVKLVDGSVYDIKDAEVRDILKRFFSEEIIIDCGGAPIDETQE